MKEEIKEQLKLSKKQTKEQRYDYLCSQFNCINYTIKLEKYVNKLQKENKFLQSQLKTKEEVIKEAREYIKKHIQKYDIDGTIGDFDEFEILASPKTLLEILSKGENK